MDAYDDTSELFSGGSMFPEPQAIVEVSPMENELTDSGPKQTRKAPIAQQETKEATSTSLGFDPKALLAPRGAGGSTSTSKQSNGNDAAQQDKFTDSATIESDAGNEGPGMGSFLERQHRLKARETELPSKRKIEEVAEDSEGHKKAKSDFTGGSSGGVLGQYVRDERKKRAQEQSSSNDFAQPPVDNTNTAIDLTNEDDDVEIVEVKESKKDSSGPGKDHLNEEICIGTIKTNVNAYCVPTPGTGGTNRLGKDWWPRMRVSLKREPNSTNVIHFIDAIGKKFGQMVINAASGLCPLLDGISVSKLRTKTYLDTRKRKSNQSPGQAISEVFTAYTTLFCPRGKAQSIGRFLSQRQLFLNDPVGMISGTPVENPHTLKKFGPSLDESRAKHQGSSSGVGNARYIARTQEEMRHDAESMFDHLTKAGEDLPEAEANKLITTPLMEHQKKALYFLLDHEKSGSVEASESSDDAKWSLWKPSRERAGWFYNVITGEEVAKQPDRVRGGILADVMGLGKTLSILSLIATTLTEAREFADMEPTEYEYQKTPVECYSRATLIICPKSVMSNWVAQIDQHTSRKLKVYTYHGSNRTQDIEFLASHHIVLTSYNTAAAEFNDGNRSKRALETIKWFRIVLDEAHSIRTLATKVSKAACALLAERRWAMTGTPVQNRLDDLGALIKFIRMKPFDESYNWAHYIMAPFKNADHNVLQHLRLIVDSVTLRRSKKTINLKDRREVRESVEFTREERIIYENFTKSARIQTRQMIGATGGSFRGKAYAHVLRSISRLRALCAHGREMLSEEDLNDLENLQGSTSAMAIELFDEPASETAPKEREERPFITENQAYEMLSWMRDSEADRCSCCGERVGTNNTDVNGPIEISSDSGSESEDEVSNTSDKLGILTQACLHLICPKCEKSHLEKIKESANPDGYWECYIDGAYVRAATFPLSNSGFANFLEERENTKRGKKNKWDDRKNYSGQFSKVRRLVEHLRANEAESQQLPPGEPPIRSVVFSGWTSYLDLIEFALVDEGFKFTRLDGSMSVKKRTAVLEAFKTDPDITVLLVSIKAGGQGLNFTTANKVYMMEPQFNPGVEHQAIDRVHRLGQDRDVEIVHFIMKDSIEESILKLQEKKDKLAQLSMEKKMSKQDEARSRIQELSELFK